jgi:hypothetical protein
LAANKSLRPSLSNLLVFVYDCFDRVVIHGYLSGLSRPEQVLYFFRDPGPRGRQQRGAQAAHRRLPEWVEADNAFLAVADVAALQASADRLSRAIIRKQLDCWTLILGPSFPKRSAAK